MNNEIMTTAQVAQQLGRSESAIRKRKSRHADQFAEGQHFVKDANTTLWTTEGVNLLQQMFNNENIETYDNDLPEVPDLETVADTVSETLADLILNPLLEQTGHELAKEFYNRLPAVVSRCIREAICRPSAEQKEAIREAFKRLDTTESILMLTGLPG